MHSSTAANKTPLRRVSTHASNTTTSSRLAPSPQPRLSTDSRLLEEILHDGDEIGPGLCILGQPISIVHARTAHVNPLRVLRKLGTGTYAVVYLVQEMVGDHSTFLDIMDDSPPASPAPVGRLFALKCLIKHAQDQEAQLQEATIHHSLPIHDNVVTLWTTLETASYLLLVLDYVPGEDLFYFLEQQRDYEETPPAPDRVLQPLSYPRLRLLASMFTQMCDAVAHCHRNRVFHRDIKPENFMVTDERIYNPATRQDERRVTVKLTDFGLATRDVYSGDMDCGSAPYMSFECNNNITPTYATGPADVWSLGIVLINMLYHGNPWRTTAIGQCTSFDYFLREPIAFFMEQFDGLTPAVAEFFARRIFCLLEPPMPPSADNGIVNPAVYSANIGCRITAEQFGIWARDLALHLGPSARRTPALAFQPMPEPALDPQVNSYATRPRSPPEANRLAPSVSQPGTRTPSPSYRNRPPAPIHASVLAANQANGVTPESDDDDSDFERSRTASSKRRKRAPRGKSQVSHHHQQQPQPSMETSSSAAAEYAASVRAASDRRLLDLAEKSQLVAREASLIKAQKTPPPAAFTPLGPAHIPIPNVSVNVVPATPAPTAPVAVPRSTPELRKKKSAGWTAIFQRDSTSDQEMPSAAELAAIDPEVEERNSLSFPSPISTADTKQTATVRNVSNLIMGLDSSAPPAHPSSTSGRSPLEAYDDNVPWSGRSSSLSSRGRRKDRGGGAGRGDGRREVSPGSLMSVSTGSTSNSWIRGRSAPSTNDRKSRSKSPTASAIAQFNILAPSPNETPRNAVPPSQKLIYVREEPPPPVPAVPEPYRAHVPVPHQVDPQSAVGPSGHRRSYAPSINSISTTTTSSSAFTAFSGKKGWRNSGATSSSRASVHSVSTTATSLSSGSGSWRAAANGKKGDPPPLPATNIKKIDGIPWMLDELPRQMTHKPKEHVFPPMPNKKANRRRPPSAPTSPTGPTFSLDPISERPRKSSMKPPRSAASIAPSMVSSTVDEPVMYESGGLDAEAKSFGAGRGGVSGLSIDTESANHLAGYAAPTMDVNPVASKPPKTPTKSWLRWRK